MDSYVAIGKKKKASVDPQTHPATARMREKLRTSLGRAACRERKWILEAPNGWIKHVMGTRRFSVRGLESPWGEWNLACLSLNIRRLVAMQMQWASQRKGILRPTIHTGGAQSLSTMIGPWSEPLSARIITRSTRRQFSVSQTPRLLLAHILIGIVFSPEPE